MMFSLKKKQIWREGLLRRVTSDDSFSQGLTLVFHDKQICLNMIEMKCDFLEIVYFKLY